MWIEAPRCAAADCRAERRAPPEHIRRQQLPGGVDQQLERGVCDALNRRKGIDAGGEEGLGFEYVANARHDALIQQHVSDRLLWMLPDSAHRLRAIERRV